MKEQHTLNFEEGERGAVIMALAHLAVERPGWDDMLSRIAARVDNCASGRPEMYEEFKRMCDPRNILTPGFPDLPRNEETDKYLIAPDGRFITCKTCGRASFNLNDVREKYCGFCHVFHKQPPP
jgi:hypothetical protein